MTGVALPVGKEFELTATEHGVVSAAALFGILIGGSALGSLSDYFGCKTIFEIMGTTLPLSVLVGTSLLDALVTWMFRIEATGIDLETVGAEPSPTSTRAPAE
jgi:putative MFS transporter